MVARNRAHGRIRSRAGRRPAPVSRAAVLAGIVALAAAGLAYGTWRDPHFWLTADQRGDRLMAAGEYGEAAAAYADALRIGTAQYRNADFEAAARTFARVPGATGAFDQGNAWLMHGQYAQAIASYDRALGFRAGWQEAEDNKALAAARQARIADAGENREEESAGAYDPDQVVADEAPADSDDTPRDMNAAALSDAELRATWLRRVQTTPGDFLRAKFAYQATRTDGAGASDGEADAP